MGITIKCDDSTYSDDKEEYATIIMHIVKYIGTARQKRLRFPLPAFNVAISLPFSVAISLPYVKHHGWRGEGRD